MANFIKEEECKNVFKTLKEEIDKLCTEFDNKVITTDDVVNAKNVSASGEIVINRSIIANVVRTTEALSQISLLFYDEKLCNCQNSIMQTLYDAQYEILEHYLKTIFHVPSKVYENDDYANNDITLFDDFLSFDVFSFNRECFDEESIDCFVRKYVSLIEDCGYILTNKVIIENSYSLSKNRVVIE